MEHIIVESRLDCEAKAALADQLAERILEDAEFLQSREAGHRGTVALARQIKGVAE